MEGAPRVFKLALDNEIVCAILSAIVICVLFFPDALFLRAGLSHTSQFVGAMTKQPIASFYPQPPQRRSQDAFSDAGGALWQMEPAQQFVRNCLKTGESPYWNPYSGAGQLGPETLVDLKFSFNTLLIALLKGSQTAVNAVLIGSYFVALVFLYIFCSRFLKVSKIAALASCMTFAFCGYSTSTVGSNTSQAYLYFPLLLCALASFCERPTTFRMVILVLVDAIILSATFFPTTFLMLLTTHLIGLSYAVSLKKYGWRGIASLACVQVAALVFALLGLGFLYFPIIESLFYVDAVSMYNARTFTHANQNSVLSFFSNKHFWEEYCAIPTFLHSGAPHNKAITVSNSMYHFGASVSIVAACASVLSGRLRTIAITCLALIAISAGRIFGIPIIDQLVSITPGIRSLGEQYWFVCTACAYVLAVPLGVEAVKKSLPRVWIPAMAVASIVSAAIAYLYFNYGFIQPDVEYKQMCVSILCTVTLAAFASVAVAGWHKRFAKAACIVILIIMTSELIFDLMYFRFLKTDYFRHSSIAVQVLKQKSGIWRVVNMNVGIIPPEQGSAFQIQQIETMNMNILPPYEAFFHRHFVNKDVPSWGRFCTFFNMLEPADKDWKPKLNMAMCNLSGVRYFVVATFWFKTRKFLEDAGCTRYFASTRLHIYENPNAYPRAFAVSALTEQALIDSALPNACRSIAYSDDKLLLKDARRAEIPVAGKGLVPVTIKDSACTISSYHNDKVVIEAKLEQPSIVVLTDNWHPNWSATLDGKPVYIGLVDETFRGVVVPKGTHRIEMTYRPKSLTAGIVATLSILALLIAALCFRAKLDALLDRKEPKAGEMP